MAISKNRFLIFTLIISGLAALVGEARAANGVPKLIPIQGRLTDSLGNPINTAVWVNFRIYPATSFAGTECYIYEETQSITPNVYGMFSAVLGNATYSTGPANAIQTVFNNDVTVPLSTSCGGATTFTPGCNEWRRLEIVVAGTPRLDKTTIGSAAFAFNSTMLDGIGSDGFIKVTGAVSQTNMATLVSTGDASTLHHHDSLYIRRDGTNAVSGNLSSSANVYLSGAASKIGIGTSSPTGDLEIARTSPSIKLDATSGGAGTSSIQFNSGTATQRGKIESNEATNGLNLYSGTSLAMQIDAALGTTFYGNVSTAGTMAVGVYTGAQETTLVGGLGAGDAGKTW